jgi:hypothetical protein
MGAAVWTADLFTKAVLQYRKAKAFDKHRLAVIAVGVLIALAR